MSPAALLALLRAAPDLEELTVEVCMFICVCMCTCLNNVPFVVRSKKHVK